MRRIQSVMNKLRASIRLRKQTFSNNLGVTVG